MDDDFLKAIDATADTSFDASAPTNTDTNAPANCKGNPTTCPVATPRFFQRRSGSTATGFLDGEFKGIQPDVQLKYLGPPVSGRDATDGEKRGAWHLQAEYLAGRL